MKRVLSLFLLIAVVAISGCTTKEAKVLITILHDVEHVDPSDGSITVMEEPVQGATVRVYFQTGNIDENANTDIQGQVEFTFENIAILDMDVTYLQQQITRQSAVRLEEDETIEVSLNLDNP